MEISEVKKIWDDVKEELAITIAPSSFDPWIMPLEPIGFEGNEFSVIINSKNLPVLDGAELNAGMGMIPGGLYRNKKYVGEKCVIANDVKPEIADLIFDPQTSGGLLISLPHKDAELMVVGMKKAGLINASVIGEVRMLDRKSITVV